MLVAKSYILKFLCELFLYSVFLLYSFLSLSQHNKESAYLDSLSFAQFENSEYSKAEISAKKLFNLNLLDTNIYRINANTLLGIINKNRGFYISSTEHYLEALNDATLINDTARQSALLNNLGTLYKLQQNYISAIDYFKKSLRLEKSLNNPEQQSIRFYNLAETYLAIDSLDMALSFFNNSLLLEQKRDYKAGIIYAYIGITDVYLKMGNAFQSELMIKKIHNLFPTNNVELQIFYEFLQAKYAFLIRDYKIAVEKIQNSIELANSSDLEYILPELILFRMKILKETEPSSELSDAYQDYFAITEKLNSQMIRNKMNDLNYQNELKIKQLEVEALRIDKEIANANQLKESRIRQFLQRILIFILGLLTLCLVLVFVGVKKMNHIEA